MDHKCTPLFLLLLLVPSVVPVPVIDVSALRRGRQDHDGRAEVVEAIGRACVETGFFYITGHGIEAALQDRMLRSARAFFSLPAAVKKDRMAMAKGGKAWRGYFAVGDELTSGLVDEKEGIYFGREGDPLDPRPLHGANLWPGQPEVLAAAAAGWNKGSMNSSSSSEGGDSDGLDGRGEAATGMAEAVADLKPAVTDFMATVEALGSIIIEAIFDAVLVATSTSTTTDSDNPQPQCDRFRQHFQNPLTLFRIFNYPPHDPQWGKKSFAVGEHSDYGFLTLLLQDDKGGLEVRSWDEGSGGDDDSGSGSGGGWIDVPPVAGTLVVNLGDALEQLTGGLIRATPHRVRPRVDALDGGRLSFPFFFDPNWDATMESAVPCLSAAHQAIAAKRRSAGKKGERWDGRAVGQLVVRGATSGDEAAAGGGSYGSQTTITYGEYVLSKVSKVFPDLAQAQLEASMEASSKSSGNDNNQKSSEDHGQQPRQQQQEQANGDVPDL